MAMLDGLVGAQIAEFLESDLEATLRLGFAALWASVRTDARGTKAGGGDDDRDKR